MIKREIYLKSLRSLKDKPIVKVLTGMRRSGKSTILKLWQEELLANGVSKDNIFFANLESLKYAKFRDYNALYQAITEKSNICQGKIYILLDEVQETDEWQRVVASCLVDFDCDIIITGSNAKLLSGELATLLAGRYIEIKIYPLSFAEYLQFVSLSSRPSNKSKEEYFEDFCRLGGLPGIHSLQDDEFHILQYLQDIFDAILLKDIVKRYAIRDTALLEKIIKFIMDNIGNTFSAKTIIDFLRNQGRRLGAETVYNYMQALENACLIHKATRFDIKGKKFLETQEKYYLSDLGIRYAVIGYKSQDIAGILENIVFFELKRRGYSVYIGKYKDVEVDFIAQKQNEILYFQVCFLLTEDNMSREFSPLEKINDNFPKYVLSMNNFAVGQENGIKNINIIDFLC